MKTRCSWARNDLAIDYHDHEWGVPCRDERTLFEFLILEGAQAGLSWDTILKKRLAYRAAYHNFDAEKIARYGKRETAALLANAGIVRNRLKITASIDNARACLKVREELGGLAPYLWAFVDGKPLQNCWKSQHLVPAETTVSLAMSKDLKRRGFRFVGSTICYALMQAIGLVNDHTVDCFRHAECKRLAK